MASPKNFFPQSCPVCNFTASIRQKYFERWPRKRGGDHPQAKLTNADAKYIRKKYIPFHPKYGQRPLAKKYRISRVSIQNILQGKSYMADFPNTSL